MKKNYVIITVLLLCFFKSFLFAQHTDTAQVNFRIFNDISISYFEQNNKLQIRCPSDFIPYKIYIYNVTGTLIYSFKAIDNQLPLMEYYLELSKGIYFVNVESKTKTIIKKIIVNR